MNLASLITFLGTNIIVLVTMAISLEDFRDAIDYPSIFIVGGGTLMVGMLCYSPQQIIASLKVFMKRLLGKNKIDYNKVIEEIVQLAKAYRQNKRAYGARLNDLSHPFLKDAAEVLFWLESDISPEDLRDLLDTRVSTHLRNYMGDANVFRTIGKFPPAFGLMGTVIGMVALLQGLGQEGSNLGKSMSVALLTTLYGVMLSNGVLVPIAENLTQQTADDHLLRNMIVEGVMLIQQDKPSSFIEEKLNSFLLPSQRAPRAGGEKGAKAA